MFTFGDLKKKKKKDKIIKTKDYLNNIEQKNKQFNIFFKLISSFLYQSKEIGSYPLSA